MINPLTPLFMGNGRKSGLKDAAQSADRNIWLIDVHGGIFTEVCRDLAPRAMTSAIVFVLLTSSISVQDLCKPLYIPTFGHSGMHMRRTRFWYLACNFML